MSSSSSSDSVVEIQGLQAGYGFKTAVRSLSLNIQRGQALALLGLNGSGKTTTIRCLLGSLRPKQGTVRMFGKPPGSVAVLKRLGFSPEDAFPSEFLSAREYLSFLARFRIDSKSRRKEEVQRLLTDFELSPEKRIRDYSKGMRRRLLLAQAFLGNPELLILDEPLNGLDPLVIIKLRERLNAFTAGGGTLLFSSHILAEVEKTCSHVAVLDDGACVYSGPIAAAVGEFGSLETLFQTKIRVDR